MTEREEKPRVSSRQADVICIFPGLFPTVLGFPFREDNIVWRARCGKRRVTDGPTPLILASWDPKIWLSVKARLGHYAHLGPENKRLSSVHRGLFDHGVTQRSKALGLGKTVSQGAQDPGGRGLQSASDRCDPNDLL